MANNEKSSNILTIIGIAAGGFALMFPDQKIIGGIITIACLLAVTWISIKDSTIDRRRLLLSAFCTLIIGGVIIYLFFNGEGALEPTNRSMYIKWKINPHFHKLEEEDKENVQGFTTMAVDVPAKYQGRDTITKAWAIFVTFDHPIKYPNPIVSFYPPQYTSLFTMKWAGERALCYVTSSDIPEGILEIRIKPYSK